MRGKKEQGIVVSALRVRTHFGSWLRRLEEQSGSLVIEKRGTPRAVLLSIRDYVRLAAPEPEVLKAIGQESRNKGTDKLTAEEIEEAIQRARKRERRRRRTKR